MIRQFSKCEIERVMSVLPCTRIGIGKALGIKDEVNQVQEVLVYLVSKNLIGLGTGQEDGWMNWRKL